MVFQFRNSRRWEALLAAVLLGAGLAWADAPTLTLNPAPGRVVAGEWFEVSATAKWAGDSERFSVVPGELESPAWGEGGWDRVEARSTTDGTELTFIARFKAKEPGSVSIPELHLHYVDAYEYKVAASDPSINPLKEVTGTSAPVAPVAPQTMPAAPSAPGKKTLETGRVFANEPTLEGERVAVQHPLNIESVELEVKPDRRWMYPYVFLGVMLAGLGMAFGSIWYGRRKNALAAAAAKDDPLAPWRTVEEALHNARRHRLDGDFYTFYRELQRLVQFVGGEVKSEFGAKIDKRVVEIGFQNQTPTEDELEGIVKDIERALARWKEGKAA